LQTLCIQSVCCGRTSQESGRHAVYSPYVAAGPHKNRAERVKRATRRYVM